eukprot:TRINITY_DN13342_c0_g1_i2.p1 TRINITY_DN13342_c0_g1~~TRINITY_DN13342_c0_g1_i2.p1  ORF type:complete len:1043 (-),score=215.29 TRINITY_DN13342_c0_g1_i2:52-3180(-)
MLLKPWKKYNTFIVTLSILLITCSLTSSQNSSDVQSTSVPLSLFSEINIIPPTVVVDNATVASDTFKAAIWLPESDRAVLWTDVPQASLTVLADLSRFASGNITAVTASGSFADSSEIAIQTGAYDEDSDVLYMYGGTRVYKIPNILSSTPASLSSSLGKFNFPDLVLPKVSFYLHSTERVYSAQYFVVDVNLPPKLYGIDLTAFDGGFNENTTNYANLTASEIISYVLSPATNTLLLASRAGLLEARNLADLSAIRYAFHLTYASNPVIISNLVLDESRDYVYFIGLANNVVYVVRVGYGSVSAIHGKVFQLDALSGSDPVAAFSAPISGVEPTGLVIDPVVGVGFLSLVDGSGLGYITKFDIKNMYYLGPTVLPVERDQTKINSMYIDTNAKVLYTLLDYSLATYYYPTSCPNDCTSPENGNCVYSKCNCTVAWMGDDCSEEACVAGCNEETGNGYCSNGDCICTSFWNGTRCELRRCPDNCLSYGTCGGAANNFTCICDNLHSGINCGALKYTTCESVTADVNAKNLCLQIGKTCGWCNDDMTCKTGNQIGPVNGYCRIWLYDGDLEAWPIVIAALIIFSWAAMFINNSISAIVEDFRIAHNLETTDREGDAKSQRRAWWRDERSAKSWKLWDQIQFLSLYTITNMYFSSKFFNFTSLFNWTNFCLPLPAMGDTSTYSSRQLSSIEQYANTVGVKASDVFWVCLIWWLIATAAVTFLFAIFYLFVTKVLGKGEKYGQVLFHRFFHLVSRMFLAGYLPVCCLAGWGIVSNINGKMVVPIIFFIIFAFGLPVFNFLVVKGEKTDFLYYQTRIRYGSLYVQFKQDKAKFAFAVYARKLVLAVCFGFLATLTINDDTLSLFWAQIIVPAIFMLIYIVLLFIVKPYVDVVHAVLDGFLNLLNILTLGVSILFRSEDVNSRNAGLFAVMTFQITGLISVIFAYSYTWMYYAGYNSIGELCGGKKREEDEELGGAAKDAQPPKKDDSSSDKSKEKSSKDPSKEASPQEKSASQSDEAPKAKKPKGKKAKEDDVIDDQNLGNLSISE